MNNSASAQLNNREETLTDWREAVERVIKTVSRNLDEPFTMEEMAQMAYMSPFHFNRVFHQITGIPPKQFLYALRLERAKHLLLKTDMTITDICFHVGYNSLGTFTSRFTELVGRSPSKYRRLAAQICSLDWERLFREGWQTEEEIGETYLKGKILAPDDFEGLIFVGLFEQMIPQSQPVAGTMLIRADTFYLGNLPDGEFYILSAALPRAADALEYLLPDFSKILVGIGERSVKLERGTVENVEITLRPLELTDPPILLALPSLITNGMARISNAREN